MQPGIVRRTKQNLILQLIHQPEGPLLEFKQEFYAINDSKQEKKKRQKDEMLKDILALANGSIETAGEEAHLVIGVSENLTPAGQREVCGVSIDLPDADDILKMVNAVCEPPIPHLLTEHVSVGDKKVYVITIPPSPYLHETKRRFVTSESEFSPYSVFIRRNSMVELANARERKALEDLKKFRFQEHSSLSNILVGGLVGAILSGSMVGRNAEKITGKPMNKLVAWVTGSLIGAFIGAGMGYNLKNFHEIFQDIRYLLIRKKLIK